MAVNTNPLTPQEIQQYFGSAGITPTPGGTYEIALVLGGTVSAGSYTAGVLDFLFEALDSWYAQRGAGARVPQHNVVIKFITGTSGGGVNAAITARALAYDFPHIVPSTQGVDGTSGNPFYDVWCNRLTLEGFLGTNDVAKGKLLSLLDGTIIDQTAQYIETFQGSARALARPYIADPLRIFLTLTNIGGVPYKVDMSSQLNETYVDHADFARFAVVYPGRSLADPRPDESVLGFDNARFKQIIDWATFGNYAMGTAAFPIGLPPRNLVRPAEHYRYRVTVLPDDKGGSNIVGLTPDWPTLLAGANGSSDYRFYCVDGGATDNEPIQLARTALAGFDGRNPRDGMVSTRGVVLVDPFAGYAGLGASLPQSLIDDLGGLVSAMIQQTRYDSRDILLALDNNVFSRFMVTAKRDGKIGDAAIASSGLSAFLGFASKAFMRHDYFLGRANCQRFLRETFVLPSSAKAFGTGYNGIPTNGYESVDPATGTKYLQIIPLIGDPSINEATLPWPKGAMNPETYRDDIEARFKAIIDAEVTGGFVTHVATWIAEHLGDGSAADFVIGKMNEALKNAGLA